MATETGRRAEEARDFDLAKERERAFLGCAKIFPHHIDFDDSGGIGTREVTGKNID